jgi:hypothetical protein
MATKQRLVIRLGCPKENTRMAFVEFQNPLSFTAYLHVRPGPTDIPPDDRGARNYPLYTNDSYSQDVGDGDVWFCFGRQGIGGDDNPQLCHATPADSPVILSTDTPCFVDN